jgi:DsbC/DsbD-like thiol-disulfide interchange protein
MERLNPTLTFLVITAITAGGSAGSNEAMMAMDYPAEIVAQHATPELIFEKDGLEPGGTCWIAVRFKIADGWHLYWNGRNETGSPPTLTPKLPAGYELGDWMWPTPTRHVAPGDILDHVYEGTLVLMAPLKVPKEATPGTTVSVQVDAAWVVCDSDQCVPEDGTAQASLITRALPKAGKDAKAFEVARLRHPKAWPADSKDYSASISAGAKDPVATIRVSGATRLEFYPGDQGAEVRGLLHSAVADGDTLTLSLRSGAPGNNDLVGLVSVARNGKALSEFYAITVKAPAATTPTK